MELEDIVQNQTLQRVAGELTALKLNAIRFRASLVEDPTLELALGGSKLGGTPDLPAGVEWPATKLAVPPPSPGFRQHHPHLPFLPEDGVMALPFIAQFNLSELKPYDLEKVLPAQGMLYFFYNAVAYPSDSGAEAETGITDNLSGYSYQYYDYGTPRNCRVLYSPVADPVRLQRMSLPTTIPPQARYKPCALEFWAEYTLPSVETCLIEEPGSTTGQLKLSEEEWQDYAELRQEWRGNQELHHLLGYSDNTQPYLLENAYLEARPLLFPELELTKPFSRLSQAEQQIELEQGRLLLQLSWLPKNGMEFGRGGRLYFFICYQDLVAGDFSRVWTNEQ